MSNNGRLTSLLSFLAHEEIDRLILCKYFNHAIDSSMIDILSDNEEKSIARDVLEWLETSLLLLNHLLGHQAKSDSFVRTIKKSRCALMHRKLMI